MNFLHYFGPESDGMLHAVSDVIKQDFSESLGGISERTAAGQGKE
jgi:hypothetical protein